MALYTLTQAIPFSFVFELYTTSNTVWIQECFHSTEISLVSAIDGLFSVCLQEEFKCAQ